MEVPAVLALLERVRRQAVLLVAIGREEDAVDDVASALVVHDRARPELGNREEAGPLQVLVLALSASASGDERRQGQPGKAVAREEAFAREVAVAVEVGLDARLRLVA